MNGIVDSDTMISEFKEIVVLMGAEVKISAGMIALMRCFDLRFCGILSYLQLL